jgi:hypothetical protein
MGMYWEPKDKKKVPLWDGLRGVPGYYKRLYLYFIDATRSDSTMKLDRWLTPGHQGITSVLDMVRKAQAQCMDGSRIKSLTISGHGNQDGMWVGNDWLGYTTLWKHRGALNALIRFFAPNAIVELGGCKVGRDQTFLQQLSGVLGGVKVRAFSASQRPGIPGDEGGARTCVFENCTYTGEGLTEPMDRALGIDKPGAPCDTCQP